MERVEDRRTAPGPARVGKTRRRQEIVALLEGQRAERMRQLGAAVARLTRELAEARRELSAVRAENDVLRHRLQ